MTSFPEPTEPASSRAGVLVRYLDFFRARVIESVSALPEDSVRSSRLPSGWTPLELAHHLTWVEVRWLEWGFEGGAVDDPWGDECDGRWHVPPERSAGSVLSDLAARGEVTRAIVARHDLADVGRPGDRWAAADPPALERVLLHLMQEYARHLGQLDIVAELAGGPTGE